MGAYTFMDDLTVVVSIFHIQSMIPCLNLFLQLWLCSLFQQLFPLIYNPKHEKHQIFHTKLINIAVFLPTLKETDMSRSSTLHPKRPSFHRTQLPVHCTACLFLYSLVYHNSLFELESSNTVPTGKHQVINAIPGMLVWVIYAQTNVAPRLQVVLSTTSLCTSRQCFWWLHLRDLPKCVCFFPKVVSRVSALGLFTSKCFCDSPKRHESQCFLFPFYYFFSSLFVSRNTAFVI